MRGVADESFLYSDTQDDETRGLSVRFEVRPKKNEKKSTAEGRPIFDEVDYIEIRVPGDRDNIVHRPATTDDKARFAAQYKRWKASGGTDEAVSGTPLKEWAAISRSQAEELGFFGVRTVEQLAATTDGNLKNIGPLLALREKARDYVAAAKKGAPLGKMREELESSRAEVDLLRAQLAGLAATVSEEKKSRRIVKEG